MGLPAGLFGPDRVDVAYEPWRAVRPAALHVGPDIQSPLVLAEGGEPVELATGQHLGRQTTRNPACLDRPPLRAAVNGFVWGYCMPPAIRKSGWMQLSDVQADPAYEELACGPAGADFDRRRPEGCGGHCDGQPLTGARPASGPAEVTARDLYLRYAPHSTAFRYLVAGDQVQLLVAWQATDAWFGVEVRRAQWTPARVRGWVLAGDRTIAPGSPSSGAP
ncbi:MAG TPA: hypothetical protein VII98_10670 [Solirubrobacteraceae bacterium]